MARDYDISGELEQIVDSLGIKGTIEALVDIFHGKAEHLRENWQDESQAMVWEDAAKQLDKVSAKFS